MTTGKAYIIPENGWLGATVASSGGFVLVCSPRAGPQTEGDCYSSENNLNSFSKIQLPYPRRKNTSEITTSSLQSVFFTLTENLFIF